MSVPSGTGLTESNLKADTKHSVWQSLCKSWSRLGDIRLARWSRQFLETCKGVPVLGVVTRTLQTGVETIVRPIVSKVGQPIADRLPSQVARVADFAVTGAVRVDQTCVCLYNLAAQVFSQGKRFTSYILRGLIQSFLQSSLGQALLLVIDLLMSLFEGVLDMISPEFVNQEVMMGGEGGGRTQLEDKRGPGIVSTSHRGQNRKQGKGRKGTGGEMAGKETTFYSRLFVGLVVAPLRAMLFVLTSTRQFFMRYTSPTKPASPTSSLKNTTLLNRRKMSPRKRLAGRSYLRRFLMHALNFLGVRQMTKFPPRYLRLKAGLPVKEISATEAIGLAVAQDPGCDKRRHSDVSSESLSDTDVKDLMQDLDEYVSEEDPDFKPDEYPSEDSLEYVEGDTESFIELDDEEIEPPKHPKRVNILTNEPKKESEKTKQSVQIADDVVKFDKEAKKNPEQTKPAAKKVDMSAVQDLKKEPEKLKQVLQKTENIKTDNKEETGKTKHSAENGKSTLPNPGKKTEELQPILRPKRPSGADHPYKDSKKEQEKKHQKMDSKGSGQSNGQRAETSVNGKNDKENQAPVKQLSPKKGLYPQITSSPKVPIFGKKSNKQ